MTHLKLQISLTPFPANRRNDVDCCNSIVAFLSRVSSLTRDIDIAILSVRLSVRYVPVSDENGLTYCRSFLGHLIEKISLID